MGFKCFRVFFVWFGKQLIEFKKIYLKEDIQKLSLQSILPEATAINSASTKIFCSC